jgi:hypothetical protein
MTPKEKKGKKSRYFTTYTSPALFLFYAKKL